jgi:3-hydroxypropanoate dehydrogenase
MTENKALTGDTLDQLFNEARTHTTWLPKPVPDALLEQLYALTRWGPTSMNMQPMRLVFVRGAEAKAKLLTAVASGNQAKVEAAPVTVIVGYDLSFHDHLQRMAPHMKDPGSNFRGNDEVILENAFRNGSLQGGYLILAARALGLDTGPMSGFDPARVDEMFFPDSGIRSNFITNIGYGDAERLYPRAPRFEFDEVCRIE